MRPLCQYELIPSPQITTTSRLRHATHLEYAPRSRAGAHRVHVRLARPLSSGGKGPITSPAPHLPSACHGHRHAIGGAPQCRHSLGQDGDCAGAPFTLVEPGPRARRGASAQRGCRATLVFVAAGPSRRGERGGDACRNISISRLASGSVSGGFRALVAITVSVAIVRSYVRAFEARAAACLPVILQHSHSRALPLPVRRARISKPASELVLEKHLARV